MAKTDKPNILFIMADDIGWFDVSCYNHGLMGYRTPNIDRIAREARCSPTSTASKAARPAVPPSSPGSSRSEPVSPRSACPGHARHQGRGSYDRPVLKSQGYATGQFGKNHLGDLNEHLPTVHGFDEFFGNLYHLNAEEEPEYADYPKDPVSERSSGLAAS